MSTLTLADVANQIDAELVGDGQAVITGVSSLPHATRTDVSFLIVAKYKSQLVDCAAAALLVGRDYDEVLLKDFSLLVCSDPRLSLAKLVTLFAPADPVCPGIHPSAIVATTAKIDPSAEIGPNVVIEDGVSIGSQTRIGANSVLGKHVSIGSDCRLHPNVTLGMHVKVGHHVVINSGTVVGSDGFGYVPHEGRWLKTPDIAAVTISDHVEIGANTTIDRGFLQDTFIAKNVIIDNQVQIGHNVEIGEGTAIAGCVGIAGSCKVGANCLIGGGAGIAGHITITDSVHITAASSVNSSITEPGSYSSGLPAKQTAKWRRNVARFQYLDDFAKRLRAVEKKVTD